MEQKYSKQVIAEETSEAVSSRPTHQKGRRFVFTYFPAFVNEQIYDAEKMAYCYYGIEECPTTKRTHYQGWCIFFNPRSEIAVCKEYGGYFRIMKGTIKSNYQYCGKDKNVQEFGTPPEQGKRNDLIHYIELIKNKEITIEDILFTDPMIYHKYGRTLNTALMYAYKHRTTKPKVHWYWGNAGTGKTVKAVSHNANYYIKDTKTRWWDGYKQQHTIILDDFRKDDWAFNNLLRLLDYYEYAGEIKGGHININSPLIIITSDEAPHHYWQGNDLAQIKRRIDECWHFTDSEKYRQW